MAGIVLGVDLALGATGIAAISEDGEISTALVESGDGELVDRLSLLRAQLREHLSIPLRLLVVEDLPRNPRFGGTALGMARAVFLLVAAELELSDRLLLVSPASLKLYATGKGNAGKPAVQAEAIRRLGYLGSDHNEADALWLADLGARLLGWNRPPLPAGYLRALDKVALTS